MTGPCVYNVRDYGATGDGRTIVGALPPVPGLFVAATHSGITLAPLLGEALAAEMIDARREPLLANFRPERFAAG